MMRLIHSARAAATLTVVAALAFIGASGAGGCSSKLETGYKPRLLGSSPETRRGFYAQPFTPEAKRAKQYEQDYGTPGGANNGVRPRPGD
jgi:poly(3-hydroxybutyrate) depolymerase